MVRRSSATGRILALGGLLLLWVSFSAPAAGDDLAAPAACATASPSPAAAPAAYRVEPNDVLEIVVLGEADLPRTITVLPDGTIAYPYIGQMKAAGLTLPELTARITAGLKAQILRPQVTVLVSRRGDRSVSVLGAVKSPGKCLIQEGWRVLDVLAASGGIAAAIPESVSALLVREGGRDSRTLDLTRLLSVADPEQNPLVRAGDILLVNSREAAPSQVQVLGEVVKQGVIPIPGDGSVLAALAAAGGVTPQAALARAVIRRGNEVIPVDLQIMLKAADAAAAASVSAVRLQAGDTLVIPQNTRRFAVLGAVTRPGTVNHPDNHSLDILAALSLAGGQTSEADLKNVTRLRPGKSGGQPEMLTINVWEMVRKGEMKRNVFIEPGDILFVPDKTNTQNRLGVIGGLIPLLGWILR